MVKEKKVIQEPDRDELAQLIAESLNKMNKDSGQVAFFLDGRESTPTDFTDFVSTGATMLDVAISNRPHGGIAVGRITELTGLEGCVTEDTLVEIEEACMIVAIKEIDSLLAQGKKVKIKTREGYSPVSAYIEKGILDTFLVTLENGCSIKVSREHKFFTNTGWVETKDIRPNEHSIFCASGDYSVVSKIHFIGKHPIVDITVDDDEHAYFGNGMLNHNSGKSLIGAQLIANTQSMGGVGVLIDTETAVNAEFFKAVGIDMNKLVYVQLPTVEEIFDAITVIIESVRKDPKKRDKIVTIVVDSVAAASTKREMEADFSKDGYATDKAIIISKALRKITGLLGRERIALVFTNQLRQKLNAMAFSDPWCVDPRTTKVKIRYTEGSEISKLFNNGGGNDGN